VNNRLATGQGRTISSLTKVDQTVFKYAEELFDESVEKIEEKYVF